MIGKTLAHYEITALLGRGGMGEVYRARDRRLDRDVALKILPADVAADPVRLERFEREARTVAGLNHRTIVHLYAVEEHEGIHFFTMELVEGRTLDEVLTSGRPTLGEILAISIAIADGLAAAHEKGVVHRDLKPANVMLTAGGEVKILDFGLAKRGPAAIDLEASATQALPMTVAGSVLGTFPYMSPEQVRGQEVDARSDLFSLGILLFELASGQRPFAGPTSADLTSSILTVRPPSVCELAPDLPTELGAIIAGCLEKDREARTGSAAEVRDALATLRQQIEVSTLRSAIEPDAPHPAASGATGASRSLLSPARLTGAGVLIAVIALAVVLAGRTPPRSDTPRDAGERTIAVLPFTNESPDEENAFFATGVHEDVMIKLGGLKDLAVVSRSAVLRVQDHDGDLRALGKRLGARYVVEGSVRRWQDQVRVTAHLVDARTEEDLWSQSYDRELQNVFAVQTEIAQEIASTLRARISPDEATRLSASPTENLDAYDDFVRARNLLNASRVPYENLQQAIALLRAATTADPGFLRAWALLSRAQTDHVDRLREFDDRQAEIEAATAEARAALQRAKELGPDDPAALRAEGYFLHVVESDVPNALRTFDRALAAYPNDVETLFYQALMYFRLGEFESAIANLERAHALENSNGLYIYALTSLYETNRKYAKMVPFFDRLLELEPEKTHYAVEARYYQFLADGSLASFRAFEDAVRTVDRSGQCDVRSVQNNEMIVAMVNDEFERYAQAWEGKWDEHHAQHGNWACPAIINDEANHARLLLEHGEEDAARRIIEAAKNSTTRPYDENSVCIFDKAAFAPKLDYLGGDPEGARRRFEESIPAILRNESFPRGAVERSVLVQTADMVAPDRVYALYRQALETPPSLVSLETICANPWTYPNLIRDPRFVAEVRANGKFVEFLQAHDFLAAE